jgi:hypothetical protein
VQVALQRASFSMVVESSIADNVYEVAICNQPATGQKKTAHRLKWAVEMKVVFTVA